MPRCWSRRRRRNRRRPVPTYEPVRTRRRRRRWASEPRRSHRIPWRRVRRRSDASTRPCHAACRSLAGAAPPSRRPSMRPWPAYARGPDRCRTCSHRRASPRHSPRRSPPDQAPGGWCRVPGSRGTARRRAARNRAARPSADRAATASGGRPQRPAVFRPGRSIGVRDDELFGGEEGDHLVPHRCHHDFLLDARGGMAIVGRAVGLEREYHAFLQLNRVLQRVESADYRPLVECESEPVAELQPERFHLTVEAEVLRLWPGFGDEIGGQSRLDHVDPGIDPLASLLVGVALALRRPAHVEGPVVAGAVAVVGLGDVEEWLVTRADQAIRKDVRMRAAALTRYRVDRLDVVGAHVIELLVRDGDDLILADSGFEYLIDRLV